MMIEPVIEIFGKFDGAVISKLREDIFEGFLKTGYAGLIFTYMWAFDMQIQSFKPLYDKYHDEGSPALETIDRVRERALCDNRKYYFIVKDGARVGAINIGNKLSENDNSVFYISPLFVLPKYQNQGIGYVAIKKAFELYPQAAKWKLDTILEEPANCHLYEKCGFVRVGAPRVINENMTIVDYEKVN